MRRRRSVNEEKEEESQDLYQNTRVIDRVLFQSRKNKSMVGTVKLKSVKKHRVV